MDIAQLRYPVAYWDGTPPSHRITCIALTVCKTLSNVSTQYAVTGASTGELVHWEIQVSKSGEKSMRKYLPRALVLRVGGARCTVALCCSIGELDCFLVGTTEGFLTLWTSTAGRCIRSSLCLPFAPSSFLSYERWVPVSVGVKGVNRSKSSSVTQKCYVFCSSIHSQYVYLLSLPHLKTIRILKNTSEVVQMNIYIPQNPSSSTSPSASNNPSSPPSSSKNSTLSSLGTRMNNSPPNLESSPEIGATKPKPARQDAAQLNRPYLHCFTTAGIIHRWDILELTAGDSQAAKTSLNKDLQQQLTTEKPSHIFQLNIPGANVNLAYQPISSSMNSKGDFVLIALQNFVGVVALATSNLQIPLIHIDSLFTSTNQQSFSGCCLLPGSTLSSMKIVLWNSEGEILGILISSKNSTSDSKLREIRVWVMFQLCISSDLNKTQNRIDRQLRTITVSGVNVVAGNNVGEVMEWDLTLLVNSTPPTECSDLLHTPSFESSTYSFLLSITKNCMQVIFPISSSVSDAFAPPTSPQPPPVSPNFNLTPSLASDLCTVSVLLTEGSGKAVLLARGYESGHVRVYGPASLPTPASSVTSPSLSPRAHSSNLGNSTVIDLTVHTSAITAMVSIGGREYSCRHAMLATGSLDQKVCVWDVSTATLLHTWNLPVAIHSLFKPPLTHDDYQYHLAIPSSQIHSGNGLLAESKLKEQYKSVPELARGMSSNDIVTIPIDDPNSEPFEDLSPPKAFRNINNSANNYNVYQSGAGLLFVSCIDLSVRAFSLTDYSQLQVFRGHDAPILTVFRDDACIKEEIVLILTETYSVFVWGMVDGRLESVVYADNANAGGALSFLQKRGLIAPCSQLSILAHHIRQRAKVSNEDGTDRVLGNDENEDFANSTPTKSPTERLKPPSRSKTFSSLKQSLANDFSSTQSTQNPSADKPMQQKRLSAKQSTLNQLSTQLNPISPSLKSDPSDSKSSSNRFSSSSYNGDSLESSDSASFHQVDALHIPIVDPQVGVKKLKHSIDVVRVDGKSHLHVSVLIVNLTRFIRDLQRAYIYRTEDDANESKNTPMTPHLASSHHLAIEALDASPQEEFNYLLSILFDWEEDSVTTKLLTDHFHVHAPHPRCSYAAITDNSQALTLLFPNYSCGFKRWQIDADMTARQALAISSVCMPLLASVDVHRQMYFSKIVAQYNTLLPVHLQAYVEPDVSVLALFSLHSNEHVHSSARLLLQGVIERASVTRRRALLEQWSLYYTYPLPPTDSKSKGRSSPVGTEFSSRYKYGTGYVSDQELMTAIVITMVAVAETTISCHSDAESDILSTSDEIMDMFDSVAPHITNTLLRVLSWTSVHHDNDLVKCSLAADTLSRCITFIRPHIPDPIAILHRLYLLSMAKNGTLSASAHRAMLEYGRIDPHSFISAMGKEALNSHNSTFVRQGAFMAIAALVKRHSLALAKVLPLAVQVIVKCLDPIEPAVRKTLLNSSLAALHALVQQYPTVCLHQGTQRFAVGCAFTPSQKAAVVVYDLRTSQTHRTFEGHKADISAVAFNQHGTLLASYACNENSPTVKIWSCGDSSAGSGSFLRGLLSGNSEKSHLIKSFTLPVIPPPSSANMYYSEVNSSRTSWVEPDIGWKRKPKSQSTPSAKLSVKLDIGSPSSTVTPVESPIQSPLSSPRLRAIGGSGDAENETSVENLQHFNYSTDIESTDKSQPATEGLHPLRIDVELGPIIESNIIIPNEKTVMYRSQRLDDADVETIQRCILKCMLSIQMQWKDDKTFTLCRENGQSATYSINEK